MTDQTSEPIEETVQGEAAVETPAETAAPASALTDVYLFIMGLILIIGDGRINFTSGLNL